MRQINLEDYVLEVKTQPSGDGIAGTKEVKYDVRGSLIEVLFAPELQLNAREILDRDDLARKIKDCRDNNLLLEEAEYEKIKGAVETVRGMGRNEVEFIRRILKAEKVEVVAK
jgi:hypothetical protein